MSENLATNVSAYYHTYPWQGDYHFTITDSLGRLGYGKVAVKYPAYYNSSIHSYYINVGDFIRWKWPHMEAPPPFPSSVYGSYTAPHKNRTGDGFYDLHFPVPGWFSWYSPTWEYYSVNVYDTNPVPFNHSNIYWGMSYSVYSSYMEGTSLVFYNYEGIPHNVRIIDISTDQTVWVSQDTYHAGDYAVLSGLAPGDYFAKCDYHSPYPYHSFKIESRSNGNPPTDPPSYNPGPTDPPSTYPGPTDPPSRRHHDDDDKRIKAGIPKSVVYVAELTLFMVGVLGLGTFILDKIDKDDDNKPLHNILSVDNPITVDALNGVKERSSKD